MQVFIQGARRLSKVHFWFVLVSPENLSAALRTNVHNSFRQSQFFILAVISRHRFKGLAFSEGTQIFHVSFGSACVEKRQL